MSHFIPDSSSIHSGNKIEQTNKRICELYNEQTLHNEPTLHNENNIRYITPVLRTDPVELTLVISLNCVLNEEITKAIGT